MKGIWLMSLIILALLTTQAEGTDYYVSPTGSDVANLCTLASPCLTPRKGANKLNAGDTLYIRAGTYIIPSNERFTAVAAGLSWAQPVRITAFPLSGSGYNTVYEQVIFKSRFSFVELVGGDFHHIIFEGIIFDGQEQAGSAINLRDTGSHVNADQTACGTASEANAPNNIRFLNVEVGFTTGSCITVELFASDLEFLNMDIHHCGTVSEDGSTRGHGYYGTGFRTIIDGGHVHDNASLGLQFYYNFPLGSENYVDLGCPVPSGGIIRNVRAYKNGGPGIYVGSGTRNTSAYNNLSYSNGMGFRLSAAKGNTTGQKIYNNTAWGNRDYDFHILPGASNSLIKNNIGRKIQQESGVTNLTLENNLFGPTIEPQFVDAANGDFRLTAGSPAVNAGQTIPSVTTDFVGTARPQGGIYDIGAYELVTGGPVAFNFALQSAGNKTVEQGQAIGNTITVTSQAGTAAAVTFSATGLPAGATMGFTAPGNCTPTTGTCTTTATVTTALTTPQGVFPIVVRGTTATGLMRSTSYTLTVTCP